MRLMPMPRDLNGAGDVFGGWLLAQLDLAASVLPVRRARGRVATVAVNEVLFKKPVSVGDLLSFYARITRIGRTSMTTHIEVIAERNPSDPHFTVVAEATFTFVALDEKGQPRPVPDRED
ncbi:acyl-CoA thioesterase [Comamonadaceae bacterium SL12-8]|uniref:Acyl-CoA thioesterase n=2 Tax=Amphibiibacter pelophylacis TaxID=1799477 RepID=A0ACC6NY10_9BURK